MSKTDTSETGFNALMMHYMIDVDGFPSGATRVGTGKLDVRVAAERLPDEGSIGTSEDAAEFIDEVETVDEEITE